MAKIIKFDPSLRRFGATEDAIEQTTQIANQMLQSLKLDGSEDMRRRLKVAYCLHLLKKAIQEVGHG